MSYYEVGPVLSQAAVFLDFSWLEKSGWAMLRVGHNCKVDCLVGSPVLAAMQV